MKVEEARAKRSLIEGPAEMTDGKSAITNKQSQSTRSHEKGTITAIELPKDRKVKRGWAEPAGFENRRAKKSRGGKERKDKAKGSSVTGGAECLFKTRIPANIHTQPLKSSANAKKRKRDGGDRESVVHEFKNSTKHSSFLRENGVESIKQSQDSAERKEWVDENRSLIEKVKESRKSIEVGDKSQGQATMTREPEKIKSSTGPTSSTSGSNQLLDADGTSSSGTSSSESEEKEIATGRRPRRTNRGKMDKGNKSQGLGITSTEGEELDDTRIERLSISRSSGSPLPHLEKEPKSVPSIEVHPLEALFKRPQAAASQSHTPKKPQLEVSTSFNFFETDVAETGSTLVPQTPFTQQDIRHRRQRSAAPTPDTAAPGRTFGDVLGQDEDSDSDGDPDDEQVTAGVEQEVGTEEKHGQKAESDFAKWFWEHRGDNNRAWKRRRREAKKEKRAKEKNQKQA